MRKAIVLMLTLIFVLCLWPLNASASGVTAESAVLMDMNTKQLLYEKNAHAKMYPASITKILTCLIVLENCDLTVEVTAPADNTSSNPYYLTKEQRKTASEEEIERADFNCVIKAWSSSSTSVPLNVGDRYTVEHLVYAAALGSANDACDLLAWHTAGTIEAFVEMMNDKAREIGCVDSHFANTNGLPNDDHYVSAYDMALIMSYAMQNELFVKFFGKQENNYFVIRELNSGETHTYAVGNEMLKTGFSYYYSAATAGKTGYTSEAGYTLVTAATISGIDVVAVVLKDDSRSQTYKDTTTLFNSIMGNYKPITVMSETFGTISLEQYIDGQKVADIELSLPQDVSFWVYNNIFTDDIEFEIKAGGTTVTNRIDGELPDDITVSFTFEGAGSTIAPTALTVTVYPVATESDGTEETPKKNVFLTVLSVFGVIVAAALVIMFSLWIYTNTIRRRRQRLKRIQRQNVRVMNAEEYSEGSSNRRG